MPCDYSKYPANWKGIRAAVLAREQHCCKECGVKNYEEGYRAVNGDFYSNEYIMDALDKHGDDLFDNVLSNCYTKKGEPTKSIRIVLTVAHLDHDVNNNEMDNLAALCQYHHLKHDREHHRTNAKATISKKKGLQELF